MSFLESRISRVILATIALVLAAYIAYANPGSRSAFLEPWAGFHYYLGAKYFNEVGPFDFYACAIQADKEGNRVWAPDTLVRDLKTYRLITAEYLHCQQTHFTPARWNSFVHDVAIFTNMAPRDYWMWPVMDKGFNATPFWSVVFGTVANTFSLDSKSAQFALFNLDLIFVMIAIAIVWRFSGMAMALFTLVLALGYFGNFGRIGGNFAQYLWFPALVLSIVAWKERRPFFSGTALGVAIAIQVFPIMFTIPIALYGIRAFLKGHTEVWKRSLVFFAVLAPVLAMAFWMGSISERGIGGWSEWYQKINVHSSYLRGEIFDIGLSNLVADAYSTDRSDAKSYEEDAPLSFVRLHALKEHALIWYFGAAMLLLGMVLVLPWTPEEALFTLGFVPIYALLSLSPYYYFPLALMPIMISGLHERQKILLAGVLIAFLFFHLAFWGGAYISFTFMSHFISQLMFLCFVLSILLILRCGMKNQSAK